MPHRFTNLDPAHRPQNARAILRWGLWDRLTGRRRISPPGPPAPRVAPDLAAIHDPHGPPRLTWIGHASFLVSVGGVHVLIDPMFSERAGRIYRRSVPPGLVPSELPPLAALLVTHSHYDHLDAPSVRAVGRDVPVCAPLGLASWFRRRGFVHVHELGWWDAAALGALSVTLVPARHWSRRSLADTNRTLWGGYVVEVGGFRFYHAGDSAVFGGFAEIGRRFPAMLTAMMPIGAYSPAWFMEHHHVNPEQAGQAFLDVGARVLVPMHWGTFQLTDEPLSEPVERLRAWWQRNTPGPDRELRVPAVGETLRFDG